MEKDKGAPNVDVEGRTLGAKFSGAPFPGLLMSLFSTPLWRYLRNFRWVFDLAMTNQWGIIRKTKAKIYLCYLSHKRELFRCQIIT